MTDITTPNASNQPGADAVPANLPAGVSIEQYNEAVQDAKARGLIGADGKPANGAQDPQIQSAKDGMAPATSPEQYNLTASPVLDDNGQPDMSIDASEFDAWRRGVLAAAEFPADLGASLVAAVTDAERRLANQSPEQREITIRTSRAELARLWDSETEQNIADANSLLAYVEEQCPGIVEYLDRSGAANSVPVIVALAHQAQRIGVRARL